MWNWLNYIRISQTQPISERENNGLLSIFSIKLWVVPQNADLAHDTEIELLMLNVGHTFCKYIFCVKLNWEC